MDSEATASAKATSESIPASVFPSTEVANLLGKLTADAPSPNGGAPKGPKEPSAASAGELSLVRYRLETLQVAVEDLIQTFGSRYRNGEEYLARIARFRADLEAGHKIDLAAFENLRREALLANPLLDLPGLLVVKRRSRADNPAEKHLRGLYQRSPGLEFGFPSNHECNSSLPRTGYDNEIALLRPVGPTGTWSTVYRPEDGGYVGEIDLHGDAERLLFTKSDETNWKIFEVRVDGSGLRQVSHLPEDVDCMDPCYLPDGGILFGSTASYQSVPCWHGLKWVVHLYRMNADGGNIRQLCFDQDHNLHPAVLPNGQVVYHRWDYTGPNHIFLRQLMVMNPDGTGQRAIYGSNSWFPNALYFPRPLPGKDNQLVAILSGYHGVHRMGQLVVLDINRGWYEAAGLVRRISGKGELIRPMIRDNLVDEDWPKFLHPFPLSEKYFLVSAWPGPKESWGIYLADIFDNLIPLKLEPPWGLFEPVPLRRQPVPPVLPDRTVPSREDATCYLHDIYAGPGLEGVPRGTICALRIVAYHFGYRHLAGPDLIGYGGPWEVMRILGTVPVEEDGSAHFRIPACTPIAVQALDAEGKAVQLMRSWFTAMRGEELSCIGCHEQPRDVPAPRVSRAALRAPDEIEPWFGPPRGFDFTREVQPVLDRYCVHCHRGPEGVFPDLRRAEAVPEYRGRRISDLGVKRLHPEILAATGGVFRYSPAYEALLPYVRRVGIEDDVSLLIPGEYHVDTSPLVRILRKGHAGVRLDAQSWDRFITWIDLNAPFHGTWSQVHPVPEKAHERRMELRRLYGGPSDDPEQMPAISDSVLEPVIPAALEPPALPALDDWPWKPEQAAALQRNGKGAIRRLPLGEGEWLEMVWIPPGRFVMGDPRGEPDEWPPCVVEIGKPFWISAHEITNRQFRLFRPEHSSRYYQKLHARSDDQGLSLDEPDQPVVRVSWVEAMQFCDWLTEKLGERFSLPAEAQWEYACRAGTATALNYGELSEDFSAWANLLDRSYVQGWPQITGGLEHLVVDGAELAELRFDDRAAVTAAVKSYRPNRWGLYDMHGNVAEWTRSDYRPYPYDEDDGRHSLDLRTRKVVRGGSFFDPPRFSRSAHRWAYPAWQRVFNVGFRVVCEDKAVE